MGFVSDAIAGFQTRKMLRQRERDKIKVRRAHLKKIEEESLNKAMEIEAQKQGRLKAKEAYRKTTTTPLQRFGQGLAKTINTKKQKRSDLNKLARINQGSSGIKQEVNKSPFKPANKSPFVQEGKSPFQ